LATLITGGAWNSCSMFLLCRIIMMRNLVQIGVMKWNKFEKLIFFKTMGWLHWTTTQNKMVPASVS